MTRPVETFRHVARVLKRKAPFILTYSNRMFPTKAVRIWHALDDRERAALISVYFRESGGFGEVTIEDCSIDSGGYNDPLFAGWARRTSAM